MLAVLKEFYVTLFRALLPGRMNLVVAWIIAFITVPFFLWGVAVLAADSSLELVVLFSLVGGTAIGTPLLAWRKGRRWKIWGIAVLGVTGLAFATRFISIFLQPITVFAIVLLAEPARDEDEDDDEDDDDDDRRQTDEALSLPDDPLPLPEAEEATRPAGPRDLREEHGAPPRPAQKPRPSRSRRRPRH